ncbi:MAG TPA: lipoyl(octanoyl) transferase, partial [Planctomycetes bacterium]|nr:lipoyl(octanoyl) transferase [Planctomycetota bacterium]
RGGDITCHEPGQLVGYPVVDLDDTFCRRDIHLYLRALEDGIIGVLGRLGLEGVRIEERTGVWIAGSPPRKIAAMGVRCNRWITSHGFALNFRNDLRGFGDIVPCGISDAGVTSLQKELPVDRLPSPGELRVLVHEELQRCLGLPLRLAVGGGIAELHRALRGEPVFEPSLSEPRGLE